jgi:hypothetical protein
MDVDLHGSLCSVTPTNRRLAELVPLALNTWGLIRVVSLY